MKTFLVVKVLESQSVCLPSTSVYSNVELRSSNSDYPEEVEVLEESANKLHLDYSKYSHCARILTLVEENDLSNAIAIAEDRFSEILDLKCIEVPLSNFALSQIGFVKDLISGKFHEIKSSAHQPSMAFVMHQSETQRIDETHIVLSKNTELSKRYLRSLHWLRNSKHEPNKQLSILFNWFAVEALLKESESDIVSPYLRWFLGFPNGKSSTIVSSNIMAQLENHPSYFYWKKEIIQVVDKIRTFRNDSTHHGFRTVDFTKGELDLYSHVMLLGITRCQAAVKSAILDGVSNVKEFKEFIPIIFEQNKYLINDVHGTILFGLSRTKGT